MTVNGRRFTPPSQIPRRKPVPGSDSSPTPRSKTMAEPSTPVSRKENQVPPKTYADAAEEALHSNSTQYPTDNGGFNGENGNLIDEDAIKESPPRPTHARKSSQPRPLGEMMDEAGMELDGERPDSPGMPKSPSPSLRSSRGRPLVVTNTPKKEESYAAAVKEPPPSSGDEVNGDAHRGDDAPAHQEHVPKTLRITDTHPEDHLESSTSNGAAAELKNESPRSSMTTPTRLETVPESYSGVGVDESPRSPVRKAHKRISSRSLNGVAKEQQPKKEPVTQPPPERNNTPEKKETPENTETTVTEVKSDKKEPTADQKPLADKQNLVYEKLANKDGEHLTSVKPPKTYSTTLQLDSKESKQKRTSHTRSPSELVSGRRAGAGWSQSAIRWAPMNVPLQRRLQTVMVLIHTLSIAGGLAIFFLACTIPLLWPILLPYLIYVLFSRASTSGELSHRSDWLRRAKIWSLFASYFPARLHRSQPLEPGRKYIFGYHPHGIISHGAFAAFGTEALGFSQLFPGITNTLLTLDANFRIPFYRDYALRMGLASVSRESCENLLSKGGRNGEGMGRAITIVVGGARESLDALPYSLKLVLKRRKGFVKLAIRCGADLVPTLAFGENDIYDQFDAAGHPYVHKAQLLVKKLMGFTIPLFHARGVFNYDVGMMPYRRPLNIVVGRPVAVLQSKTPDPAYVDEVHAAYVEELLRLWEEWKDTFARGRSGELEIVE